MTKYKWEDDRIYILKGETWLKIPLKDERTYIIDKAHASSAHFGIVSTFNRIKEEYFWPKMFRDIENFINDCSVCIRNTNYPVQNHPAFANQPTNINDEVSIDFTWGYETTAEGYKGAIHIQGLK